MYQVVNKRNGNVVAGHVAKASTLWERTKGLLGRSSLEPDHGLWIDPCKSIHTFFMQFPIDVVFISHTGEIVGLYQSLLPFTASAVFWSATSVIELPVGTIQSSQCEIGHILEMKELQVG